MTLESYPPEKAETFWGRNSEVMRDPSSAVDQLLKRKLAAVACATNGCAYCTAHSCSMLKKPAQAGFEGWNMSEKELQEIITGDNEPANEMEKACFDYVRSASEDPTSVPDKILQRLKQHLTPPQIVELAVGVTLRELIYDIGGGITGDRGLLGVIPGGSSTPVLKPDELVNAPDEKSPMHAWHGKSVLDVPLGVDTMRGVGTMLGTCCATVMAEGTDPVAAFHNLMQFSRHESCGQCTPCREGTGWLLRIADQLRAGT